MKLPFKIESKQIGSYTYTVTQLDALRGRRAAVRLGNVLGIAGSAVTGESPAEDVGATFLSAVGKILERLTEEQFDYFCDLFAEQTAVSGPDYKGQPQLSEVFATHFADRYGDMIQWFAFCLEVNFRSFIGGLRPLFARLAAASASSSPKASTGGTGAS